MKLHSRWRFHDDGDSRKLPPTPIVWFGSESWPRQKLAHAQGINMTSRVVAHVGCLNRKLAIVLGRPQIGFYHVDAFIFLFFFFFSFTPPDNDYCESDDDMCDFENPYVCIPLQYVCDGYPNCEQNGIPVDEILCGKVWFVCEFLFWKEIHVPRYLQ